MHWTCNLVGANFIDFQYSSTSVRKALIQSGNMANQMIFQSLGWDLLFRLPVPTNPINNVAQCLEDKYHRSWMDNWIEKGQQETGCCRLANVERTLVNVLTATGSSTIHFTWTYDRDIKFNPQEAPN
jgi:hypothetical protein